MKRLLMFLVPILMNLSISLLYLLCEQFVNIFSGEMLLIRIALNAIAFPVYINVVVYLQTGLLTKKCISNFLLSYFIIKLSLLLDLLNTYLFSGALDSMYWLIFNAERAINSTLLIVGWIIIIYIRYKRKIRLR